MSIGPPPGVDLSLNQATPTPYTTSDLADQLCNVGLSCSEVSEQNLKKHIAEVSSQFEDGKVESYGIHAGAGATTSAHAVAAAAGRMFSKVAQGSTGAITGNWTPNSLAEGYANVLEIIQSPAHFQWLYDNRATNGFTGQVDNPPAISGNYPNAASIQKLFVTTGQSASSTLVAGLNKPSMLAALTNIIAPLENASLSNYLVPEAGKPWPSRVIYLVENYDPNTKRADGIGVLFFSWTLSIKDFKRKTKDGGDTHATVLQVKSGSVLYEGQAGVKLLCQHYHSVLKQFGIDPAEAPACPPT